MKRRLIVPVALLALGLLVSPAYAASLRLLSENPGLYDLQEVEIVAEVLDELAQRNGTWLNVSDDTAGMGIWVEKRQRLPDIMHFGSYNVKGDILRVKGIFQASCDKHLGQMDVHAQEVVVIGRGIVRQEEVAEEKKRLAFGWLVFFLITFIIYLVKRFLKKAKAVKKK
jgi:hypothetical protein